MNLHGAGKGLDWTAISLALWVGGRAPEGARGGSMGWNNVVGLGGDSGVY